jgi:hypothetical protein
MQQHTQNTCPDKHPEDKAKEIASTLEQVYLYQTKNLKMQYYILENKVPQPVTDLDEWNEWMAKNKKNVKRTELPDGVIISTDFLGISTNNPKFYPDVFETMIKGGEHDEYQERYSTWEDAEIGHDKAIRIAFNLEENEQKGKDF